ncbi:hypothetical protein H5410_027422 [Solanum commersonii]|uniref:Polyprotein protein n=1 Tax=Solanum commersonii TaxID=4109 RepID=A0A9J5YZT4_SOLCO|nr:hypothetical protein H5410_027422 [Solanum commersonii]
MIESAILVALTPLQTSVDALTVSVIAYESRDRESSKITALKDDVAYLRKDVHREATTDKESEAETDEGKMVVHDDEMTQSQEESIF